MAAALPRTAGTASAADGTTLAWESVGAGEPLLLVSGQSQDRRVWDRVRADYAVDGFRVLTCDHRGTGASGEPPGPFGTRDLAADLVAVLEAAEVERAHCLGFSMGGRVLQHLAVDAPARVASLVLAATTPGDAHGVARPDWATQVLSAPPSAEGGAALLRLFFSPEWLRDHPEEAARLQGPTSATARRRHFRASQDHDGWDLLPRVTAPTLVVHGEEDRLNVPGNARLIAERVPGAELLVVPGARHGLVVEHHDVVWPQVRDFLRRHPC